MASKFYKIAFFELTYYIKLLNFMDSVEMHKSILGIFAALSLWNTSIYASGQEFNKDNTQVNESSMGRAVCASKDFETGDLILMGWGEPSPCRSRYTIQVDADSHLIPDEPFVWLNHSCEPNCGLLIYPELCILELHALHSIKIGDELTVDYATFEREIDFMPKQCLCGSKKCRGRITGYIDLPEELRKAYGPYIAPYLMR